MSWERRLSMLERAFHPGALDRGVGSCYATIKSFLTWWLQPINRDRLEEMYEECLPEWVERFGERQVQAAWDELVAKGSRGDGL